jgi:primosomal protein N'
LTNQPKIIFGLRKTLGLPLNNLGLIYIFNSHDDSYKSWDLRPYFNYETTLNWLANLKKIPIYFQKNELDLSLNKQLDYQINTFDVHTPKHDPKVEIIVNRAFNKKDMLGISLKEDLLKHINNQEKWVLFLNKKGF